jgi:acyl carrier protein
MRTIDSQTPSPKRTDVDSVRAQTREFIERAFGDQELGDHDDIFALGYVNSLFAMQLVLFVERAFGITVESEDLDIDNFRSVAAIGEFVQRNASAHAHTNAGYSNGH